MNEKTEKNFFENKVDVCEKCNRVTLFYIIRTYGDQPCLVFQCSLCGHLDGHEAEMQFFDHINYISGLFFKKTKEEYYE